jgi:hypothetical protein
LHFVAESQPHGDFAPARTLPLRSSSGSRVQSACVHLRVVMQRSASLGNLSSFVETTSEYLSLVNECERSQREALGYPITSPLLCQKLSFIPLYCRNESPRIPRLSFTAGWRTVHLKSKFKFAFSKLDITTFISL